MKNSKSLLLLISTIFLLNACASPRERAFLVDPEDFDANVKTVTLAPLSYFIVPENPAVISVILEGSVKSNLAQADFDLIVPDDAQEGRNLPSRWSPLVLGLKDHYSTRAGIIDTDKLTNSINIAYKQFMNEHSSDAFLFPVITMTKASWREGTARWDDVSEHIAHSERCTGCYFVNYEGTVPASSLKMLLLSKSGEIYYEYDVGIELLSKYEKEDLVGVAGGGFEVRPNSELFKNPKRLEKVVQASLLLLTSEE